VKSDKDIIVYISKEFKKIKVSLPGLKKLAKAVCCSFIKEKSRNKYHINVAIVGDRQIRQLNSRFLHRRTTTDCLSFNLSDDNKQGTLKIIQLVVNGELALRQAKLRGHSSQAELALYITHGLLHNFGFDDCCPALARKMHYAEDEILQQLGYGLVYNK
jgi:probable rRNA maturation factor